MGGGGGFAPEIQNIVRKRNYLKIQYNLKPSIPPTFDVIFG
jgi:hypothetical protein